MYKYFDLNNLPVLTKDRITRQVSSYDRRYENKDWGNYLYDVDDTTSVIFDDPGCGCIKSIWMAVPSKEAFLDFYFGGESTPRYSTSLFGLFNGECPELTGTGNTFEERGHWEEADCRCGNCFIQIPYENGLKITVRGEDKEKCYYHIMYESYPEGKTFSAKDKPLFESSFSDIKKPSAQLKSYTLKKDYNDFIDIEQSGVIREITIRVKEDCDLSKVSFYICFDGARAPQVSCPVSALFAQPVKWEDISSYALTSKKENGYVTASLFLPMPFFKKLYLGMVKLVPEEIELELGVVIEENHYDPETTGHFYADHRDGHTVLFSDWNIGTFSGRGHIVGLSQSCVGGVGGSYCEGNEHFYIDGERSPSINGTGTEDIYLGCYWPNMKFDSPCAGCINDVYLEVDSNLSLATTRPIMYYRYYLDMPIAFENGIRLDVQHGAVCQNFSYYTTTCFSYRKDDPSYTVTDCFSLSQKAQREMHSYRADGEEYTLKGKLESDMRAPLLCKSGYKTKNGKVSFNIALDPNNNGAVLRRLYDQSVSNANAKVYADGEFVGIWHCCNINTYFPYADSDIHIPATFTRGKESLNITIVTDGIYTDFDYTVLS